MTEDYSTFEHETWYSFQNPCLFDSSKFIFLYQHYRTQQTQLLQRWQATVDIKGIEFAERRQEDNVLSSRWKYAIRR